MDVPIFNLKVSDQNLKDELMEAFSKTLEHGRFFMGPEVEEFEEKVATEIGTKYAVGVSSGSSALYMALKASGIGPGDEVITTPLTWIITINAIAACGAIPVFADVLEDFNINPASIEERITSKTKAIVPMHYAGHMCDMEAICSIANKNGLVIVEDAAQAYGASLNGKKAGSFSLAAGISMNPMKVLGGYGENGAVVTNDENVYQRLKILRHAGTTSDPKIKFITNECVEISLNHKMDTINAALLLVALKHFPEKKKKREAIARKYDQELSSSILRQGYFKDEVHGRYCYAIKVKKQIELKKFLENNQIETKILNQPLACDAPIYRQYNNYPVPLARKMIDMNLVIPSHEILRDEQVDFLISKLNSFSQS
ncbi:DegT/DnrJ/EryC1/StrS family aminotransferase [Candidatus Thioglobus sp.]|jgi:dTDP-4-amino-4,6-dideoxygalactose transaminase|nr:DegT/DnrJ/EryC1/StrS family aminotransferase [Candidatus Thioglobus sp.]